MGDWSAQPWDNDEAADWFHRFWRRGDMGFVIETLEGFDPKDEAYDSVRAACHVLLAFASPYCWPEAYADRWQATLEKAVWLLSCMIDPPGDDWNFLEMWGGDPEVIASVQGQIDGLRSFLPP